MSTTDVPTARWRKSRHSNGQGECVEVGLAAPGVAVRDTRDRGGPALTFGPAAWQAFTRRLKNAN
jgi:hypothetical protein